MSDASSLTTDAARAAAPGAAIRAVPRSGWHVATVAAAHRETPNASRLELDVDGWPGNAAGQHLDVRLTAPDGYTATRSYSIASSGPTNRVTLAVDKLPNGEVSPYLVDEVRAGDMLEVHGPLGAFFVWAPADETGDTRPVQLIAGGSGVVPLFAMARAHDEADDPTPFRLDLVYTRRTPEGWPTPAGRIMREALAVAVVPATERPRVYVCGSTGFVERVADWLVELGHDPRSIRTERYGGL